MKLSPLAMTAGATAVVGGTAAAAMAATDGDAPRKILMGVNTLVAPVAATAFSVGVLSKRGSTELLRAVRNNWNTADFGAFAKWGAKTSSVSDLTRSQSSIALGAAALTGVGMANLAGYLVLDVQDQALSGKG